MFRLTFWSISLLVNVVCASIGNAQTRFEWPRQQADVATYKFLDICLGAANRVRDSIEGGGVSLTDTLTFAQYGPFRLLDQAVVNSAGRCSASTPLSSVSMDNTLLAQNVLLIANRDAEVAPLYRKRLDATPTDTGKIAVIVSTARLLLNATPSRIRLADSLLADIQPYDEQWVPEDKLDVFGLFCRLADDSHNDVLVTKYCGSFLTTANSMDDAEFTRLGPTLPAAIVEITRRMKRSEFQDSLAKSTSAFVSFARASLAQAFRGWSGGPELGMKTEPIVGDFWFPESAKGVTYPRPGRVTLLLGLPMRAEVGRDQLSNIVILRRLAARFPELDIVGLTGTTGHFGPLAPPAPAEEAALNYRRFNEFNKIPLVMAVTTSPYWHLTDPDRRRIFDPYPHSESYQQLYKYLIGVEVSPLARVCGWACGGGQGLLVDSEGVIVDWVVLSRENNETLMTYIDILLKRAAK